jgi:hypothetical protein
MACGAWAKLARVRWHDGLLRGPTASSAQPARARRDATRALPMVTAWWPRGRRWAGATDGVQPGDEVQGIQWRQLTREEGEVLGKEIGDGAHPSSDPSVEWWGGAARWRSVAVELARWSSTT